MRTKAPTELFVNWYAPSEFTTYLTARESRRGRKGFPEQVVYVRKDTVLAGSITGYVVRDGGHPKIGGYLSRNAVCCWGSRAEARIFGVDERALAMYEAGRYEGRIVRLVKKAKKS